MKDTNEIYMDFKRARQAAEELEKVAEHLHKISGAQLPYIMDQLSASWKCPEAETFQGKEERLRTLIIKSEASVRSAAAQIRRDAQRLYEAELRAFEIASTRTR